MTDTLDDTDSACVTALCALTLLSVAAADPKSKFSQSSEAERTRIIESVGELIAQAEILAEERNGSAQS